MNPLDLVKRALLDIDHLLREGFDCNWQTTTIPGVQDTVRELREFIVIHDPEWFMPK